MTNTDQYHVMTNDQSPSGKWVIYADENGTIVGQYDDPESVRGHLCQIGLESVLMDVDGNGSFALVPVEWIGDGAKIVGSPRALELITD